MQLGQLLILQMGVGSGAGGPDFSHRRAGEQLFPKYRADGGINAAIQRGFVNTKNKQARRCVLEGHVQAEHFQGRFHDFAIFRPCVLSKVLKFILLRFPRISGLCRSGLGGFLSFESGVCVGRPPGGTKRKQGCVFRHVYLIRPFGVGKQARWSRRWIRQIL